MTGHKNVHPIQTAREARGWSRMQLALEAGLALRTIDRIEDGHTEPQPSTVRLIALVLDVPESELLQEEAA